MKRKNRMLAVLLSLIMVIGLMPISAFAEGDMSAGLDNDVSVLEDSSALDEESEGEVEGPADTVQLGDDDNDPAAQELQVPQLRGNASEQIKIYLYVRGNGSGLATMRRSDGTELADGGYVEYGSTITISALPGKYSTVGYVSANTLDGEGSVDKSDDDSLKTEGSYTYSYDTSNKGPVSRMIIVAFNSTGEGHALSKNVTDGGTLNLYIWGAAGVEAKTAKEGDTVVANVVPSDGYELAGLYILREGEQVPTDTFISPLFSKINDKNYSFVMPGEPVTVAAVFVKDTYTVTFDFNGGTNKGMSDALTLNRGSELDFDDYKTIIEQNVEAPQGKKFDAFEIDGTRWDSGKKVLNDDIILKVLWKDDSSTLRFTVTFDANGGRGSMESVTVNRNERYTLPEPGFTAPAGKEFAGWEVPGESLPLDNPVMKPGERIRITSDINIKAIWKTRLTLQIFRPSEAKVNEPYTISGRSIDAAYQPAAGFYIVLYIQDSDNITMNTLGSVTTDSNGCFSLSNMSSYGRITQPGTRKFIVLVYERDDYFSMREEREINFSEAPYYNLYVSTCTWDASHGTVRSLVDGSDVFSSGSRMLGYADYEIMAFPAVGYRFKEWRISSINTADAMNNGRVLSTDNPYTYTLTCDSFIVAEFEPIPTYTVSAVVNPAEGGAITFSTDKAKEGEEVTFKLTLNNGYTLESMSCTDGNGPVAITPLNLVVDEWKFTMPANDVTVAVTLNAPQPGNVEIDPDSVNFDPEQYGYDVVSPKSVTLHNGTSADVTVKSLEGVSSFEAIIADRNGSSLPLPYTLSAGESINISVNPKTGLSADTYNETLTITCNDGTNDETLSVALNFVVTKAPAPTITYPTTSPVTYGQMLSEMELTGGSTELGDFAWALSPDYVLKAGRGMCTMLFTPNAQTRQNYEEIPAEYLERLVWTLVNKATPAISVNIQKTSETEATVTATVEKAGAGTAPTGGVQFFYSTDNNTWTEINGTVSYAEETGNLTATLAGWDFSALRTQTVYVKASYDNTDRNYNAADATTSFDLDLATYPITLIKTGTGADYTSLSVPSSAVEGEAVTVSTYDLNNMRLILKSIEVKGADGSSVAVSQNEYSFSFTMPAQAVEVTIEIALPQSTLLSISATGGTLTPAFDPNVRDYTVTVPYETEEIGLTAESGSRLYVTESEWKAGSLSYTYNPHYSGCIAKVTGAVELAVGENTVHIEAGHINGVCEDTVYTVTIVRQSLCESEGHDWGEWIVTKAPTCTETGEETRTCKHDSGHIETREVPALGHTPAAAVKENEIPATCEEDGSYENVIYCETCGEELSRVKEIIPAHGHGYGEWKEIIAPTCTNHGAAERTCNRCGHAETRKIDPNGHDWEDSYTVDKAPTCTEEGSRSVHCRNCDAAKDSEVITPLGHDWGEWTVTKEATEAEEGIETRTCNHDTSHTETRAIPKLDPAATSTIRYDLNGGVLNGQTGTVTIQAKNGTTITLPAPTREGYTFDYWEGSRYNAGDSYTVNGDHTFTAQWKRNGSDSGRDDLPQTGDASNLVLWFVMLILSLLGIAFVLFGIYKERLQRRSR